jgi:exopolysaccharide biosynthesis protein
MITKIRTPFRTWLRTIVLAICVMSLAACTPDAALRDHLEASPSAAATVTSSSTSPSTNASATPGAALPSDSGWQQVDRAMEARTLRFSTAALEADVSILRFDPHAYRVRVKYDQANPGFLNEWNDALQPLAMINGGYFDENKRATGLVIFDGTQRGQSYRGFGGMVAITEDGEFDLRSLRQDPYNPKEPLRQAMQSAPMLIQPGGEASQLDEDNDRSRRSVIARDRQGRVLLIAIDLPVLTLPDLAQALKQSDLDLDAALNLDGGRSTGLYLNTNAKRIAINSFDELPLVLVVEKLEG